MSPSPATLSADRIRAHRSTNRLHTVLIVLGMFGLVALLGWLVGGGAGLMWGGLFGAVLLWVGRGISPQVVLRLYGGIPLALAQAPRLYGLVEELARRADLPRIPRLYYVPSQLMNAFTVGEPENAVIGVTDGILRGLSLRELAGVLAHEVSHIRNRDLRVMALADVMSRITGLFALFGQVFLVLNLPLLLMGQETISWLAILLLLLAPSLSGLLQLGLSRTREFDADLDAAILTGDPEGLAGALRRMEVYQGNFFEHILMPGRRVPDPSLFRSHPKTEERIDRLLGLRKPEVFRPIRLATEPFVPVSPFAVVQRRPRWRVSGIWY